MAEPLPQAESLHFYGMAVFDTGVVFDFETRANEAEQAAAMLNYLQRRYRDFEWSSEGLSYEIQGAVDNYAPPKVNSLLVADATASVKQRDFTLRISDDVSVNCTLSDLRAYFYLFNAAVLHFKVFVPEEVWTDRHILDRVRHFIQLHAQPADVFGLNVEGLLGPTVARLRRALNDAVKATRASLLDTPYLDFGVVAAGDTEIRWTHSVLVAVMPEPFDPDSTHFQSVLLDITRRGIRNFARHKSHYAFVESGDSLVVVPTSRSLGRPPEEAAYENWVRWITIHQYTWKMAWELDRGLYAVLNTATAALKHKRRSAYRDVYALNALLNFIWLLLDTHKPRNMTSAYHSIYFLEQIAETWRTDEILAAAEEKMAALRDLIGQLDELETNRRGRRVELFLTFLGVFSLGSLVLDVLGSLSVGAGLGDGPVIGLVSGIVFLFMLVAYLVLR